MAGLMLGETEVRLKYEGEPTNLVGLGGGMIGLFFGVEYAVVRWQTGDIVSAGRSHQQLTEVAPWQELIVAAFNIEKSSLVLFHLGKGETLLSFEFNFNPTECVNSLFAFGGTRLAVHSRTAMETVFQYFNADIRPIERKQFSTLHFFDKLDQKSGVAAYCQQAHEGAIAVELLHCEKSECKRLLIRNIKYEEDSFLQRVWRVSESELLMGLNHSNRSYWQLYNVQKEEHIVCVEQTDIIQETLFIDTMSTQTFSFVGMKRREADGKIKTVVYTICYRTQTVFERYIDFCGEYTPIDRRTILFCNKGKQEGLVRLQTVRAITKDNYYLHLLKRIGALDHYGNGIGSACLNLLNFEHEP